MNISELSIRRPVLATVLTIIILLFGLIGYNTLGVREYPSVDNPIISVTCSYSGANADVIYNPQNEMFRLLGTKRSFSQNETFFFSHPYPALFRLISHF